MNCGIQLLVAACVLNLSAAAQERAQTAPAPFVLGLPLACKLDVNCWVAQYVDENPHGDALDYSCGHRTYHNHNGTDFAIEDRRAMAEGIAVVAAADGTVARMRDGVEDRGVTAATRASVAGHECGNAVVLRHEGGWQTTYCHMRQGSVVVHIGDHVTAGQKLGLVGLSGLTEFPHVHLTVQHDGKMVDPFIGLSRAGGATCGAGQRSLWRADLAPLHQYQPFAIYHAGFADRVPKEEEVRAGDFDSPSIPVSTPVLGMWADIFGVQSGDVLTMRLTGPDGAVVVEKRRLLPATQARYFEFIGRKRGQGDWAAGKYLGEITMLRPITGQGGSFEKRLVRELSIQ